jgi:uncharacterized cysteine cluster protein YcgN (CxxCxxCC family)
MKRFTATEKWDDSWFRKLKPAHKLLWQYLCDKCDQCGVWKVDLDTASHYIGAKVDASALVAFGGRVRDIGRERWWVPGFIAFQFGKLNESCPYHVKAIKLLEEHRLTALWEAYLKDSTDKDTTGDTTPIPPQVGIIYGIGIGEGKGEPEGAVKDGDLVIPDHLNTGAFLSEWESWKRYRRGRGKGKDLSETFRRNLKFLSGFTEPEARAIIDKSISCVWTGLFAPNSKGEQQTQSAQPIRHKFRAPDHIRNKEAA